MSKHEMNEIIDGIYFEKLGMVLTHLQQWQKKRNSVIDEVYHESINNVFVKMEKNNLEMRNQMGQFIKVLNLQYAFLSKLKKEEKNVECVPVFKEFKQFTEDFTVVKDSLLELSDFLGKFIGVTSYEFTELKRVYDESEQHKYRFDQFKSKSNHTYNQKKELICSKKNIRKHFELAKILSLVEDLQKDKLYHNELSFKMHGIIQREIYGKAKMYKDICDNLEYISLLYQRSFKQELLSNIKRYFQDKFIVIQAEKARIEAIVLDTTKTDAAYKEIQEEFYGFFNSFLAEITVASWNVSLLNSGKDIAVKNETQKNISMVITFDNKVLLYEQEGKNIDLQINLQDLKVYQPQAEGKIELKNKKNKEKYVIRFSRIEKEDEFLLHYEQIAQKT